MPTVRPKLIFLSGPQEGQRVVLADNVALAGRSPEAAVRLVEEHTSRRQMRFELTPDGWTVENLSPNGTRVGRKTYKAGKRVLLATGDAIGVGLGTEILFVGPMDDPDEALLAYRQAHPPQPAEAPEKAAKDEKAERAEEHEQPGPTPGEPSPATPGRKKVRLYAALGAVYGLAMIGLVVFLATRGGREREAAAPAGPPHLNRSQIVDILKADERRIPNDMAAREALETALALYPDRRYPRGNLFKVVGQFKLHLAHKRTEGFDDPLHERMSRGAMDDLIQEVGRTYENGWRFERDGDWRRAYAAFQELQEIIPDPENPIFQNVVLHLKYVKTRMGKRG